MPNIKWTSGVNVFHMGIDHHCMWMKSLGKGWILITLKDWMNVNRHTLTWFTSILPTSLSHACFPFPWCHQLLFYYLRYTFEFHFLHCSLCITQVLNLFKRSLIIFPFFMYVSLHFDKLLMNEHDDADENLKLILLSFWAHIRSSNIFQSVVLLFVDTCTYFTVHIRDCIGKW